MEQEIETSPPTLEELQQTLPLAEEKMASYISRFGNEDGHFDEAYLLELISEEIQRLRLQKELDRNYVWYKKEKEHWKTNAPLLKAF